MFKFIRLIMVILMGMLLFAGCGGSDGTGSEDIKTSLAESTDSEAPKITISGKSSITIVEGSTYTDAGATATDNLDGTVKVTTSGSVNSSKVGTYTITYTAVDKAGNITTVKRTVKVVPKGKPIDNTAPIITLSGKSSITIKQGTTYTDAGATAKDDVDGVVTVKLTGSVDSSKVGTYTITYTATDKAGNKATAKRTVKVVKKTVVADITPPVITIQGDNPASVVQNATYTDAGATAVDTIDGTVTVKSTGSVDTSTLGEYTITYTATDKAGNKATDSRKVNVTLPPDTIPPVITITGDNPLKISQGETFSDPGATAVDDRDGTVTVTPSGTVDMSTVADYTITYTATDKAGNETNETRIVTVKPADVVWEVSTVTEFRQALEDAAANGENDRIVFSAGIYKTTSDNLGTFTFDDNEAFTLTIESAEGLTNKDVILDGNNTNRVFNFNNTASSTLMFKGVSVINGKNGIYCNKNIEVEDCNISKESYKNNSTPKIKNSTIIKS